MVVGLGVVELLDDDRVVELVVSGEVVVTGAARGSVVVVGATAAPEVMVEIVATTCEIQHERK